MQLYDIKMHALDGKPFDFAALQDKVVLFVNVASACGLTPQYAALQKLYEQYKDQGFTIIAVPCNQFGAQEPGSADEIKTFCETKFSIRFPITEKVDVNGDNRHDLYRLLIANGEDIEWNFAKFLVNREGRVVARFHPKTEPLASDLVNQIAATI